MTSDFLKNSAGLNTKIPFAMRLYGYSRWPPGAMIT
ncbi:hypothetical protein EPYR_01972 [Erwinia pyrifoliae DSM 12163]|nr:hypothetical protein EPYR_01972 [Erwinia pyrifoliae DSM 12163]